MLQRRSGLSGCREGGRLSTCTSIDSVCQTPEIIERGPPRQDSWRVSYRTLPSFGWALVATGISGKQEEMPQNRRHSRCYAAGTRKSHEKKRKEPKPRTKALRGQGLRAEFCRLTRLNLHPRPLCLEDAVLGVPTRLPSEYLEQIRDYRTRLKPIKPTSSEKSDAEFSIDKLYPASLKSAQVPHRFV